MLNDHFAGGRAMVGAKELSFSKRIIRQRFQMYVPDDFTEDQSLVSNYTYLFSRDKSPLSIAIKFTPATTDEEKERMISHYFGQSTDTLQRQDAECGDVFYRETVTSSQYFSIYSLRFAVVVEGGLLFGCFNSSAAYQDDWRQVVLYMLSGITPISPSDS